MTAIDPGTPYDAVIVGSGFGGSMVAHELVDAGWRVLMIERGGWVPRGPQNWADGAVGTLTPYYSTETPYRAVAGAAATTMDELVSLAGLSPYLN